jgi:hypothetical protein
LLRQLARKTAYSLLGRTLERMFRRVVWTGDWNPPPADRPTVIYANHHAFYDGQLLAFLCERVLRRQAVIWVEELDRFPFLAPLGALRFPPNEPAARMVTIRRTVRLMRATPSTAMVYFPEGHLHAAEEGVAPFPSDRFVRLAHLFENATWWPIALRVTGWHQAWPTALLRSGEVHEHPSGRERAILQQLLEQLQGDSGESGKVLLEGRASPHERWDMSWMRRLFIREPT